MLTNLEVWHPVSNSQDVLEIMYTNFLRKKLQNKTQVESVQLGKGLDLDL